VHPILIVFAVFAGVVVGVPALVYLFYIAYSGAGWVAGVLTAPTKWMLERIEEAGRFARIQDEIDVQVSATDPRRKPRRSLTKLSDGTREIQVISHKLQNDVKTCLDIFWMSANISGASHTSEAASNPRFGQMREEVLDTIDFFRKKLEAYPLRGGDNKMIKTLVVLDAVGPICADCPYLSDTPINEAPQVCPTALAIVGDPSKAAAS
jgi:hypothetical protein